MAGVAWLTVKNRLVAALPAVVGAKVYDGPVVTGEHPTAYVTVGWSPAEDNDAGSFDPDVAQDGFSSTETGSVVCEFAAVNGSARMPNAFAMLSAFAAWVQADMTLGVLTQGSTCALSVRVVQAQTTAGATQRLIVSVNYFTRVI